MHTNRIMSSFPRVFSLRRLAMLYAAAPFCPHCNGRVYGKRDIRAMYYVPVALPLRLRRQRRVKVRKDCVTAKRATRFCRRIKHTVRPKSWTLISKMTSACGARSNGHALPRCEASASRRLKPNGISRSRAFRADFVSAQIVQID